MILGVHAVLLVIDSGCPCTAKHLLAPARNACLCFIHLRPALAEVSSVPPEAPQIKPCDAAWRDIACFRQLFSRDFLSFRHGAFGRGALLRSFIRYEQTRVLRKPPRSMNPTLESCYSEP